MQSNSWGNTQQRWTASGFPFSIFVMVAIGLTAFLALVAPALYGSLMFVAPTSLSQPWSVLTYPLVGAPSIWTIFDIGLVYFFCGSLERAWGTKPFALFFVAMSVVCALSLSLGASVIGQSLFAVSLLPVVCAAVVWGLINSQEQINFFFLPLRGIHISLLACAWIIFNYGGQGLASIPFALVGPLAAFGWLKYGVTYQIQSWGDGLIPMSRPAPRVGNSRNGGARPRLKLVPDKDKPLDDRFTLRDLNPFEWYAKRKRRKQFEKLVGGDD